VAELTTQERLQPSLLDRLTDDEPENKDESRERRVINSSRLREFVTRDLAWLLNAVHFEAGEDLDPYPFVRLSVLNYGIPDLTGVEVVQLKGPDLRKKIREAVQAFEPRLSADSLNVEVLIDTGTMSRKSLQFVINSEMWAQPIPQNLYLKTEVDLETGKVRLADQQR
jgi:type VI secretion system protein ImpF